MNNTESPEEIKTGSYFEAFLYRAPKKNHSARESGMEAMESIANTLSINGDEDFWMELEYFREHSHCNEVYSKMEKDKSLETSRRVFYSSSHPRKEPHHRWFQSPQVLG
jgi:hypothetical protein